MDPIGVQKKVKDGQYHASWQKLLDGGGAKEKYQGQRNMSSGTNKAEKGSVESKWQGTVKGETKHTYGVGGKNREGLNR